MSPLKAAVLEEFHALLAQVGHEWDGERKAAVFKAAENYAQLQWLVLLGHDDVKDDLAISAATLVNYKVAGRLSAADLLNQAALRAVKKISSFVIEAVL